MKSLLLHPCEHGPRRPPHGGRGLKYTGNDVVVVCYPVAPRTGGVD